MSYEYRDIFYKGYYRSQVARREATTDVQQNLNAEKDQFRKELLHLLPRKKDLKILDMGCGYGALVQMLKEAGYTDVTGVDVSEEQVKVAHELGIKEVQQGDVNAFLENHKEQFDLIIGMDIIEHFSKDELTNLMLLVKAALRSGGQAIFRTPNMDAPLTSVFAYGDFTHENYMNASSATQLMLATGFDNAAVLPSVLEVKGGLKNIIRQWIWGVTTFRLKLALFASGRSSRGVVFTPNMIIQAQAPA